MCLDDKMGVFSCWQRTERTRPFTLPFLHSFLHPLLHSLSTLGGISLDERAHRPMNRISAKKKTKKKPTTRNQKKTETTDASRFRPDHFLTERATDSNADQRFEKLKHGINFNLKNKTKKTTRSRSKSMETDALNPAFETDSFLSGMGAHFPTSSTWPELNLMTSLSNSQPTHALSPPLLPMRKRKKKFLASFFSLWNPFFRIRRTSPFHLLYTKKTKQTKRSKSLRYYSYHLFTPPSYCNRKIVRGRIIHSLKKNNCSTEFCRFSFIIDSLSPACGLCGLNIFSNHVLLSMKRDREKEKQVLRCFNFSTQVAFSWTGKLKAISTRKYL